MLPDGPLCRAPSYAGPRPGLVGMCGKAGSYPGSVSSPAEDLLSAGLGSTGPQESEASGAREHSAHGGQSPRT